VVTEFCGFRPNYDEGKTMGLAPYGDLERFGKLVRSLVRIDEGGGVHLDLGWFEHPRGTERRFGPAFARALGAPCRGSEPLESWHRDAAAAFERVLEERVLELTRVLRKRTRSRDLVISGGVALNSVMNGRLLRESGFDSLYVMAGAGDNGTSIGAAYYVEHATLRRPRRSVHDDPYLGTGYGREAIAEALAGFGLPAVPRSDVVEATADRLRDGRVVAFYQGRMEFGPRALGARSILANPTLPDMKATLNARVKHREPFRPFAPSVVAEAKSPYFETSSDDPFMLKVCAVRPERRAQLPAVTHVDASARLQTFSKSAHPRYHALLMAMDQRTSFNVMGQPIVESPTEAIHGFLATDIDCLAIGDFLLDKATLGRGPKG
jgi:carbamoyltransferase